MVEEVQKKIDEINEIISKYMPWKLCFASVDEVRYVEKNARYMTKEQFAALVNNIKKDGALASVPLLYRQEDGSLLVLSGNHRVKAAKEAGVKHFLALVIDRPLTKQEQIAIQLSHNAIQGQDDQQILHELWLELQSDIEAQVYSGLTTEDVEELEKASFETIREEPVRFEEVSLLFLPDEIEELKRLFDNIVETARGKITFVASIETYHAVLDGIIAVKESQNIVNTALAFYVLAQTVNAYLEGKVESIEEGIEDGISGDVPFRIGRLQKMIKKETAKKLRDAINKLLKQGMDIDEALEEICGGHLQ